MNKFNIRDKVKYCGPIVFLQEFFNEFNRELTVVNITPNNSLAGNKETNVSGQYLYSVESNTGTRYLFLEDQLTYTD